ncbi:MAG: class III signal peptide-containing protein [Candidatus Micrarchaeota archaeon]
MDEKAQGAFEYILLLAAVLLIVVLSILILKGDVLRPSQETVRENVGAFSNATNCSALNASEEEITRCLTGT